jgi:hypothetical protein
MMSCGKKNVSILLPLAAFLLLASTHAEAELPDFGQLPDVGAVNVLTNGATGDCVHDDADAIDWVIFRLQHPRSTGRHGTHSVAVYFPKPPGRCYLVRKPIRLRGPSDGESYISISLIGDGRGVSVIRAGAAIEAVLQKDRVFDLGDTITDLTFDANARAEHAIEWLGGSEARFTRIEALNGRADDLYLGGHGTDFFSDSYFMNDSTFPEYNIFIDGTSTDNEFTNNVIVNASVANIIEHGGGSNHFISNHAYGFPYHLCPKYSFIVADQSIWIGNQSDCARESTFVLTRFNAVVSGNVMQGAANHGICLSPSGGNNTVVGNQIIFGDIDGTFKPDVPAANAVVQGVMEDQKLSCAGPGVRTATWGTGANHGAGNVVLSNTPASNENIWNTIYNNGAQDLKIGIGTPDPQARLDVNGAIRVGESVMSCTAATAGSIRFDATSRTFFGCNGISWVPFTNQN